MVGRAEYEKVEDQELFEGKPALSIFPWLRTKRPGKGMIIGERGLGKTFLALKIAEETPTRMYQLNKKTLDYELYKDASRPRVIIIDDLHYLMQVMRLGYLEGSPYIREEEVIQILKDISDDAEKEESKLVFVSDEGPGGLSYNFQKERNRKEFLGLFKGCVCTADDTTLMLNCFGEVYTRSENVYMLREHITDELSVNMRKELGMTDIPLVVPPVLFKKNSWMHKISGFRLVVSPDEPERCEATDISWFREERDVSWTPSRPGEKDSFLYGQEKMITVREARVLSDKLGGLSRKNLSGNVLMSYDEIRGLFISQKNRYKTEPVELESGDEEEHVYKLNELYSLQRILEKGYLQIIKKDYKLSPFKDLATMLASATSDKELSIFYIVHELSKE